MKKIFLIALLLVIVSNVSSEVEIGISSGYGFPVGGIMHGGLIPDREFKAIVDSSGKYNYSEYKNLYISLGKGIKVGLDVTFFMKNNLGIFFGTGLSALAKYDFESIRTYEDSTQNAGSKNTISTTDINGNFIPINIGLKFMPNTKRISPYILVAPGIYFPFEVKVLQENKDDKSNYINNANIKYAPGFGVTSALGVKVNFSKVIGLKIECAPTYVMARIKKIIYYDDYGKKYDVVYDIKGLNLPENTNTLKYAHGGARDTFSSIDVKIGIVFSF